MKEGLIEYERQCQDWNDKHPIGTRVDLEKDSGELVRTVTRSKAYICEAGYPVIFLDGVRGYYLLDRVSERPDQLSGDV